MISLIYDVPRWHTYLNRESRWLDLLADGDKEELRLADEIFSALYAGEPALADSTVVDPHRLEKFTKVHAELRKKVDFAALAEACKGDPERAAEEARKLLIEAKKLPIMIEQDAPESAQDGPKDTAPRVQDDDAEDVLEGLDQVEMEDTEHEGDRAPGEKEKLLNVGRLAARFKRALAHKQKTKVRHGADEVVDVVQGDDIARFLPSEMLRLAAPRYRMSILRDYVEKRCLQYAMESVQPLGRGPIVLCLDKSRSMTGARDAWGCAVALAVLDMAHRQNRDFVLLGFDDKVPQRVVVKVETKDKLPERELFCLCGGEQTRIMPVLDLALLAIERSKKMARADIVLVTDGDAPTTYAGEIRQRAARLGTTILGIGVGDAVAPETLKLWCDEVHIVNNTQTLDERVAQAIFSI